MFALQAELPAYPLLLGLTATIAVVPPRSAHDHESSKEPAGRVGRALWSGAMGAALGGLLVGDSSLGWGVHGAFPALALLPSILGSFWGGYRLWQFSTWCRAACRAPAWSRPTSATRAARR